MTEAMPLIARVRAAARRNTLTIDWKGGGRDTVDLTGLLARINAFAPLKEPDAFSAVHPDDTSMGIEWDCGLDLSGSTLKIIADEQRPMPPKEFTEFLTDNGISIREAADLFGSSQSTIKNWRSGKTMLSVPVASTVRSMMRDETVILAHFRPQYRGRPRKQAD